MKFFYWTVYSCAKGFFSLFYQHHVFGKQHIPHGPCVLAPNHASFYDPPLVGYLVMKKSISSHEVLFLGMLFLKK